MRYAQAPLKLAGVPHSNQLLVTLALILGFDGLYLLDIDTHRLMQIDFPRRGGGAAVLIALGAGFLLGALALATLSGWWA